MRVLFADIASGETDVADVLFLAAFIVFLIATVWAVLDRAFHTALMAAGLALVSLGWLLL